MTTQSPAAPAAETGADFLDAALRIGRRLAGQARWEGDACTWQVMSPDRENPGSRRAVASIAGPYVYEGTAGIALFLAELYGETGDEEVGRAALGAVHHALAAVAGHSDTAFGYHSGRPGVAYAAMRVGERLDRPELFARAEEAIRPLAGNEDRDHGMDVIAGGGGAIPALLRLARRVDPGLALGIARGLGDNLLARADREAAGWAWPTMRSSSIRNLCGYAHGAAGMGHGLLELYAATGDGRYRYGAEQAFLYERRFLDTGVGNWPDLRHTELGEYLFEGRTEQLRTLLRGGGRLPDAPAKHMSAWCHGAPGIGLARLRAWQVLGDPLYLEEARTAFRAVEASLSPELGMNYSLCHGRGGNAETLLEGARILGEPALLAAAEASAREGIETYEQTGQPWPCGTMGSVSDPGLLLGEAGIGLFLLRLARPDVPSALVITAPDEAAAEGGRAGAEGWAAERERTVAQHFGGTLQRFRRLGADPGDDFPGTRMDGAPARSDVEAAHDALQRVAADEADPARRALLQDALRVDAARYDLAASVTDYTHEFLDGLARLPAEELDLRAGPVALSPRVRLVTTSHDWDAWLESDATTPPEEDEVYHLVQFAAARTTARRLSPFAAVVLQAVETPATVDAVLAEVEEAVSGGDGAPDRAWLEARVTEQLAQAYRAGLVTVELNAAA